MTDYPCGKFGDCIYLVIYIYIYIYYRLSVSVVWFYRADRHRQTDADADECLTPASVVELQYTIIAALLVYCG